MKKSSIIILFFLMLLSLTSCQRNYQSFAIGEENKFIDKIYDYIEKNEHNYVLVDVRQLDEEYAKGHFFGFINYDIENGSIGEFVYKIESMYSKDKAIFIIDKDGSYVNELMQALKNKKYKKIYIYEGGYSRLFDANNNDFTVVIGKDDCGC